ncbi:energy transducer TonB, partial [Hydrogenimonas sp.]
LSIAIHLSIFMAFYWLFHHKKELLTSSGAKRVELSLSDFITPSPAKKSPPPSPPAPKPAPQPPKTPAPTPAPKPQKPAPEPQKATPPKPEAKPAPEKKPQPKTEPPQKRRPSAKPRPKPHKTAKAPEPRPKPQPKPVPTPPKPAPSSPTSALAGALGAPAMPSAQAPKPPSIAQVNQSMSDREFHALYKDEFNHFTPDQKKFIRTNLNRIQAITQHYLTMRGYPVFAIQQHMQGVNVVEFYLHPNGDITDLKVISSSGFNVLDDNSLDTIKTAYKDYPRPKETTKIRFYIHYQLY